MEQNEDCLYVILAVNTTCNSFFNTWLLARLLYKGLQVKGLVSNGPPGQVLGLLPSLTLR